MSTRGKKTELHRTAAKEVETVFGNLRPSDKFVQERAGIEYMVAKYASGEQVAVGLTGSLAGRIVGFADHDPVIKLID